MDEKNWQEKSEDLIGIDYIDFNSASIGVPMNHKVDIYAYPGTIDDKLNKIDKEIEECRTSIAYLLNTSSGYIHFTNTTTNSFEIILKNLNLKKGDEILTTKEEYDSIIWVLNDHREKGISIKFIPTTNILSNIEKGITKKTRLIVTSHITHKSCETLPAADISRLAQKKGIPYILNAAQSIGHINVDIGLIDPDYAIGCGHKWLRGNLTVGMMYISNRGVIDHYIPSCPYSPPKNKRYDYRGSFSSYESMWLDAEGLGNSDRIIHLGKSLKEFEKIGWNNCFNRIAELGVYSRELLKENTSIKVISKNDNAPGFVAFNSKSHDLEKMLETLNDTYRIALTPKPHHGKPKILILSVSPFNTKFELDILNEALYQSAKTS